MLLGSFTYRPLATAHTVRYSRILQFTPQQISNKKNVKTASQSWKILHFVYVILFARFYRKPADGLFSLSCKIRKATGLLFRSLWLSVTYSVLCSAAIFQLCLVNRLSFLCDLVHCTLSFNGIFPPIRRQRPDKNSLRILQIFGLKNYPLNRLSISDALYNTSVTITLSPSMI